MNDHKSGKVIIELLEKRAVEATTCPSEAARSLAEAIGSPDWRDLMSTVHIAVDRLVTDGVVQLSWKGKPLDQRAGPYRIQWRRD